MLCASGVQTSPSGFPCAHGAGHFFVVCCTAHRALPLWALFGPRVGPSSIPFERRLFSTQPITTARIRGPLQAVLPSAPPWRGFNWPQLQNLPSRKARSFLSALSFKFDKQRFVI